MDKNCILRVAAVEFALKVRKLSSPLKITIVGSVAWHAVLNCWYLSLSEGESEN